MKTTQNPTAHRPSPSRRTAAAVVAALSAFALLAPSGHAEQARFSTGGLMLTLSDSQATVNGSGLFDVRLTNNSGSSSFQVSAFSYELGTDPGVVLTGASADPTDVQGYGYIFGSYQGIPGSAPSQLLSSSTATDLIAGDADFADPYYTTLGPGQSVSLGDVSYTFGLGVTPGQTFGVSFVNADLNGGQTTISDLNGTPFPLSTSGNTLTVSSSVAGAPEPSEWAAIGFTALGLGGLLLRARRRLAAGPRG